MNDRMTGDVTRQRRLNKARDRERCDTRRLSTYCPQMKTEVMPVCPSRPWNSDVDLLCFFGGGGGGGGCGSVKVG